MAWCSKAGPHAVSSGAKETFFLPFSSRCAVLEKCPKPLVRVGGLEGTVAGSGGVLGFGNLARRETLGACTTADAGMPLPRRPTRVNRASPSLRRPGMGGEVEASGTNGLLSALSLDATEEDDPGGRPAAAD